jgi:AbrB family looped-hinge helix DNA binding protein
LKGKDMAASSKISSKHQVLIPKAVRERMAWRPGRKIAFIAKADGVLMVPIPEREELAGMARGANPEGYRDRNDRY